MTEPEYSEEARKARLQGTVMLCIEVDTQGQAQHIKVSQSLGLGLDDRAIDAVKKWKFKPGKVNGKPTAVLAYVEVNFRLL
jgi:protein TonB